MSCRRRLAERFWPDARNRMKVLTVTLTRLRQGAPGSIDASDEHAWARVDADATRFLDAVEAELRRRQGRTSDAIALNRLLEAGADPHTRATASA